MWLKGIEILIVYVVAIYGGSVFVVSICKRFSLPESKQLGLQRAGRYIGFFERFIVITLVLLSQYTAIAFILTAKSIARFDALKDRQFAEYYLIGTLSSISWAIFWGLVLRYFLSFGAPAVVG